MQAVVQSALARAQKKSAALQNLGLSLEKLKELMQIGGEGFSLQAFPCRHSHHSSPLNILKRDTRRVQLPAPFIG